MTTLQQPTTRQLPVPDPSDRGSGNAIGWVLGSATVTMGLFAGVLYAFACAVMVGLHGTGDRTFVDVMQRINVSIQNPIFFASMLGSLVLPVIAAVLLWRTGSRRALRWTLIAIALSVVAFAITAGINIPLNDQLARAGDPATIADLASVRTRFEVPWDIANVARAAVCTAALACLSRATLLHGRHGHRAS